MRDLISRQAAIDAVNMYYDEFHEGDPASVEDVLKALPSAQPERCEDCENFSKTRLLIPQSEIIRCKDCKHHHYDSKDIPYCDRIDYGYGWKDDDFCSRAERRTDEKKNI